MKQIVAVFLNLLIAACALASDGPQSLAVEDGTKLINDVQLYYKTMGKGEPIVVVHGGPGMDHS